MITKIWEEEAVLPEKWIEGLVCPIYKRSDKLACGIYYALLIASYKLLSTILRCHLSPIARELVAQYKTNSWDSHSVRRCRADLWKVIKSLRCGRSSKSVANIKFSRITYSSISKLSMISTAKCYGKLFTRTVFPGVEDKYMEDKVFVGWKNWAR